MQAHVSADRPAFKSVPNLEEACPKGETHILENGEAVTDSLAFLYEILL